MPIFFAFFRMLPGAIELRKEPWILWIQDLSQADPWMITPVLMGVAMFYSTRRSMSQSVQMEGFQKQIFYMMPIMFTVICLWAPSGLVVYWLFSNLIQMGQQELLRRGSAPATAGDKEKEKEKEKDGEKPDEKKGKAGEPAKDGPSAGKDEGRDKKKARTGGRKRKKRRG
jgi:membrane protein insertase Oxa1/YidC/SpoIIIJ